MATKAKRKINIICKRNNGEVFYVEQLDFNKRKYNQIENVSNYIAEKVQNEDNEMSYYCDYSVECKENVLYKHAIHGTGRINWNTTFFDMTLDDMFIESEMDTITIIYAEIAYGYNEDVVEKNGSRLLRVVFKPYRFINAHLHPYKRLLKCVCEYTKEDIIDVIKKSRQWPVGFISMEEFEFKKTIEKTIMKKLGYKQVKNRWKMTSKVVTQKSLKELLR